MLSHSFGENHKPRLTAPEFVRQLCKSSSCETNPEARVWCYLQPCMVKCGQPCPTLYTDEQRTLSAMCNAQTVLSCGTMFSMSCKHREAVYEAMTSEWAPSLWQWAMIVQGKLLCTRKPRSNCLHSPLLLIVGHSKIAAVFNMKSQNMEKFLQSHCFNSSCGNHK